MATMQDRGFRRGVNLGGWLSQCDYSPERLNHFIEEPDIERIASWGLDHVRLPIDFNVVQREDGTPVEEGYALVERAVGWCRKYGLNIVLDLHKTAGFSFDAEEREEGFFDSAAYQERFYALWEEIARRWGGDSAHVAFELLNEVTDPSFIGAWNRIAAACIRRIRPIAPDTLILVGSYHNNSAHAVPALDPPADDRVVYNFHCYEPVRFTHQGAYWVPFLPRDQRLTYEEAEIPDDYFELCFAPALEAAEKAGCGLYCGEYGVIDLVPPEEMLKWYRAIHASFEKHGIARCAWSYREMDFGLADPRLDSVRGELLKLL